MGWHWSWKILWLHRISYWNNRATAFVKLLLVKTEPYSVNMRTYLVSTSLMLSVNYSRCITSNRGLNSVFSFVQCLRNQPTSYVSQLSHRFICASVYPVIVTFCRFSISEYIKQNMVALLALLSVDIVMLPLVQIYMQPVEWEGGV